MFHVKHIRQIHDITIRWNKDIQIFTNNDSSNDNQITIISEIIICKYSTDREPMISRIENN